MQKIVFAKLAISNRLFHTNSIVYMVDHCPVCPSVSMLVDYASKHHPEYNLVHMNAWLQATAWEIADLRKQLSLSASEGITLFATVDDGFDFSLTKTTGITRKEWRLHLRHAVSHAMMAGRHTEQDFLNRIKKEGLSIELEMLSGESVEMEYSTASSRLMFAGGEILYSDIIGVDGIVHFVRNLPLPKAFQTNAYLVALDNADYRLHTAYLNGAGLSTDVGTTTPITAFFVPNKGFDSQRLKAPIPKFDDPKIMENMLFDKMLTCADLIALEGHSIQSLNGRNWTISISRKSGMPCFDTTGYVGSTPSRKACVSKCDTLGSNGLIHELRLVLLYVSTPEEVAASTEPPTTARPTDPPSPPVAPVSLVSRRGMLWTAVVTFVTFAWML